LTTIRFLESSSLIKIFIHEVASPVLRAFVDASGNDLNAFSLLAEVEVRSALHRRLRNHQITNRQLRIAMANLDWVLQTWVRVPLNERVVRSASGVIASHALRSLDALQLASALMLREQPYFLGHEFLFIAADTRLLAAASAEALPIWNPETSAPPAPFPPVN